MDGIPLLRMRRSLLLPLVVPIALLRLPPQRPPGSLVLLLLSPLSLPRPDTIRCDADSRAEPPRRAAWPSPPNKRHKSSTSNASRSGAEEVTAIILRKNPSRTTNGSTHNDRNLRSNYKLGGERSPPPAAPPEFDSHKEKKAFT